MAWFTHSSVLPIAVLLISVSILPVDLAAPHDATEAELRMALTLNGVFSYFWKADPHHQKIEFLFVCGQLGELGTSKASQCSCYSPTACINCYRWFTALFVESVATHGIYMNTTNHSSVPSTVYKHSPYNSNWDANATCTYIDDFLWYGIAYLRVYDWLADEIWLNRTIAIYDWAWEYGWDKVDSCGGFIWSNCPLGNFKFNIELVEAMHLAAKLAYTLPNETRFLKDAEFLWNWFFSYDNGYGLMSDDYLVSTGAIPNTCCNATSKENRCFNSKTQGTSYNQGLLISSAAYLYLITGNKTYLNVGIRAVDAVIANYTSASGVLVDEPRGTYTSYYGECVSGQDPGGDWYSFNGIFMLHLGYFTELLVKNGSMPSDTLKKINNFVQTTSDSAWLKSAVWPPFNLSDACKPGSNPIHKNASYPKFHWWWEENVIFDPVSPSDPGYYYRRSQLRCVTMNGNSTQIWDGEVKKEEECIAKCDSYKNCSKYLWQVYETDVPGTNCWIWSYNRTDHICNESNYDWSIGIKRHSGNATCAGKCDSSDPQLLDHGVCYCDANCSTHLDCCDNYVDHCHKEKYASCKGYCDTQQAQPVSGGGYCWCSTGCNPGYTGGSCCTDYNNICLKAATPICLDGRSQGSALNLFLSHVIVNRMK